LAAPLGDTGSVGIAGLTLGGGIGWLVRKHGLTIDSLTAVEIVTADGLQLTASATENEDLFWAVRGGGGNFGVVTRFQYRLHEVGMILGGAIVMPATKDVLRSLVPIAASAPRELSTISFYLNQAPPLPFVAPEHHGKPAILVMFVFAGDPDEGQRAIAPFREVATPLGEMVAPMPYPAIYQLTAGGAMRGAGVMRSQFLETLDDAAIDAILREMPQAPGAGMNFTQIRVLGGAYADVPADATAFAHRDATVMVAIHGVYTDERDPVEAWADRFFGAVARKGTGAYSNFLEDEGEARVREAYPAATYERLARAKRRYDPTNVFHRNQNIRPA
jgi:FAD/FMN-containing dehydrogenase